MHEILSLALVVLGYTSPLDYSHLNLWIMWGRLSAQKKMVFPSANKIFSHLSVGIWMHSHCRVVPYNLFFADCPVQFPCSANAGGLSARAVRSGRTQQGRQGQQGSTAPPLGGEYGPVCRHMDNMPTADTWTNPSPEHSAVAMPQSLRPPWEAPGQRQWPPLLQANTFAPFSDLACACGGRSFGSSKALSEAHLWVSSVPFLGTAGAGRGTDFTRTGTLCPTWQLALPWPTSTTMGTHTP